MKVVGKFYGHFVYFVVILVYFSRFGMFYQGKSGNPVGQWSGCNNQLNYECSSYEYIHILLL
jgi:hypothetical protein